jgi:hypothetical protein
MEMVRNDYLEVARTRLTDGLARGCKRQRWINGGPHGFDLGYWVKSRPLWEKERRHVYGNLEFRVVHHSIWFSHWTNKMEMLRRQLNKWFWSLGQRFRLEMRFWESSMCNTFREMGLDYNTLWVSVGRGSRHGPGRSQHLDPGSRRKSQHSDLEGIASEVGGKPSVLLLPAANVEFQGGGSDLLVHELLSIE